MKNEIVDIERLIGSPLPFQKADNDASPVYFQLANAIQNQIENGRLKAGSLLPSERNIASLNDISIATVRKAFEELNRRQYVYRIQGKGTYVSTTEDRRKKVRYYPFAEGFHETLELGGIQFIELTTSEGLEKINDHLRIGRNEKLYILKRLIIQDDVPAVYCMSYLPMKLFKNLEAYNQEEIENYAFYIFVEEKFRIPTIRHIELFKAVLADQEVANILNVEKGHPLLKIEKLVFTHKSKPYEYRISYCLTDDYQIRRFI